MKVNRVSNSFSVLEKSQMEAINKLQDKIELLKFDISKDKEIIRGLENTISRNKTSMKELIKEIKRIKKEKNYSELNDIIRILKIIILRKDDDDE